MMNAAAGIFLAARRKGLLPSGFIPVAWLDCDTKNRGRTIGRGWGAYAQTDITGLTRDTFGFDGYAVEVASVGEWNFLVGAETTDNESGFIKIRRYGANSAFATDASGLGVLITQGDVLHVTVSNGTTTVNGNSFVGVSSSVVNTSLLCIGGAQLVVLKNDGYKRTWPGLIGPVKVYSGDALVGDFRPARRSSDGIYGFYCMVSKKFYPSANPQVAFKEGAL